MPNLDSQIIKDENACHDFFILQLGHFICYSENASFYNARIDSKFIYVHPMGRGKYIVKIIMILYFPKTH